MQSLKLLQSSNCCFSKSLTLNLQTSSRISVHNVAFANAFRPWSLPKIPRRSFSTDDTGFHDDFKTIRKQYENKSKQAGLSEDVRDFITKEIEANPLVVFMKGTPTQPTCGFSKLVVQILLEEGVPMQKN